MANRYSLINKDTLQDIADAIRTIDGTEDDILVSQFADRIRSSKVTTYGVRFYGSSVTGTRMYDSVGRSAGINGAVNDFDEAEIYKDIQPVYLDAKDSSGNTLLDSNGNAIVNRMIKIPNFYVKHVEGTDADGTEYDEWQITNDRNGRSGFYPVFADSEGNEKSYALVGAFYTTYLENQTLCGVMKGQNPIVNKGQNNIDDVMCHVTLDGELTKLHGAEDLSIWSAISILFMVEFATRNCQSVMNGISVDESRMICNNATERDFNVANSTTSVLYITSNAGCIAGKSVGDTVQIYNGRWNTRTISAIDTTSYASSNITAISLDEEITLNSDPYVSHSWAEAVGTTDSTDGSSGTVLSYNNTKSHFRYRGMEDIWGNLWSICSGYYFHSDGTDDVLYRNSSPVSKTASGTPVEGCVLAHSNGYVKKLGMTTDGKGVALYVKEVGASSTTYYSDYFYQSVSTNNYVALCGGYGNGGAADGFWYFGCGGGFALAGWGYGLRASLIV